MDCQPDWNTNEKVRNKILGDAWYKVATHIVLNFLVPFKRLSQIWRHQILIKIWEILIKNWSQWWWTHLCLLEPLQGNTWCLSCQQTASSSQFLYGLLSCKELPSTRVCPFAGAHLWWLMKAVVTKPGYFSWRGSTLMGCIWSRLSVDLTEATGLHCSSTLLSQSCFPLLFH